MVAGVLLSPFEFQVRSKASSQSNLSTQGIGWMNLPDSYRAMQLHIGVRLILLRNNT